MDLILQGLAGIGLLIVALALLVLLECVTPRRRGFRVGSGKKIFPAAKRRWSSYGYHNGYVKVRWLGDGKDTFYKLTPEEENCFHDNPALYMMMQCLPAYPEGLIMKIDDIEYCLSREGHQPTKTNLGYSFS